MTASRIAAIEILSPYPVRLAEFYAAAFDAVPDGADAITIGAQTVRLKHTHAERPRLAPANATSFQHFAIVVANMALAMSRLSALSGWQPISLAGPQRLPASSGGATAFKFRDPDGHPLELLEFATDRVPFVWRNVSSLFAGIDHTAITIVDTARSLAFWRGSGFSLHASSLNAGAEQSALDGIPSPRVEVSSLRTGDTPPHLELLCYRQPVAVIDCRAEDDVLASRIILQGQGLKVEMKDPDGHRLAAE
jgi:catechol 2,3-dioxygenase-like lactoylglutathione lyase family enzyme